jgi:hypothetical protein
MYHVVACLIALGDQAGILLNKAIPKLKLSCDAWVETLQCNVSSMSLDKPFWGMASITIIPPKSLRLPYA